MRIAIIGAGTSAILTTLQLLRRNNEYQITIFHDSSLSHLHVGESSTPVVANLIFDVLNISIHDLFDLDISSYKRGINFVDWGKGNNFLHNFCNNQFALHFDTVKFNSFIHHVLSENNFVTYVDKKIDHYPDDFDFVIDCSGWSKIEDEYDDPFFETVNSAITFKKPIEYENPLSTLHKATEDGWMFGLPFIKQNEIRCGYLYNSKFSNPNIQGKQISWKPKIAKKLIQNEKLAYNGNKLFFLEPLQALSLHYYIDCVDLICDFLEGKASLAKINLNYSHYMWSYQLSLAFHYQYGSIYKSSFWKKTKSNAEKIMHCQWLSESRLDQNISYDKLTGDSVTKIGIFDWKDIEIISRGMTT
jgi:hypothetical protein